ncbi:hypothetical protein [Paludisphaera sp.]|uniref:hypothetical protein n=1 Tax=Paludisphaera sp. TaxID=2017432 RepID=UPI00301CA593
MAKEIDVTNLSFIDLLSCGLGGILLMLLLFAALIRTNLSRDLHAEQAAGGNQPVPKLASGEQLPPPDPLSVQVFWSPEARYPLRLRAYPPRAENGTFKRFGDEPALTEEEVNLRVLTEEKPSAAVGGDRYHGLFARFDLPGRRSVIDLLVPKGRSAVLDLRLLELTGDTPQVEADRKRLAKVRHGAYWEFEVVYPNDYTERQRQLRRQLDEHWAAALRLRLQAVRAVHPAAADGTRSVQPREFRDREVEGATLAALLGKQTAASGLLEAIADAGEDEKPGPAGRPRAGWAPADGAPGVAFDTPGGQRVSAWLRGWEVGWGHEPSRKKTQRLAKLLNEVVWPGLFKLKAAKDDPARFHREALDLHANVGRRLDQQSRSPKKRGEAGVEPVTWQTDMNSGLIAGAFAQGDLTLGSFFQTLEAYADQFIGTAPDAANEGRVTVRLEVRSQTHGPLKFKVMGKDTTSVELRYDKDSPAQARFHCPNPGAADAPRN